MSSRTCQAFVHGVAVSTSWADASRSLTDLIFDGVCAALEDAGTTMDAIDSVVLASHDMIDGRSLSSMVAAPAAGAYLRDEIRLADDGLAAASLAAARVEAGESRRTVVAAWARASEGDPERVGAAAFDPFLQLPLGLRELDVSAARLAAWQMRHPGRDAARREAASIRQLRAGQNPRALAQPSRDPVLAFPLRAGEGPHWADVVVAAVIGRDDGPVRIGGVGHSTDLPAIGDRDLVGLPALREAVSRALAASGRAIGEIDLFECDGMTLADEILALEALGLAEPGEGFAVYAGSALYNRSGGSAAGWCFPAMGLVRLAECALQITGRAGAIQLAVPPRRALAIGCAPIAAQTHSAIVLEAA